MSTLSPVYHSLDKVFGPAGTNAGYFLLLAGLASLYFSALGLILVFIGAFTAFSSTGTILDLQNKRVKFCNNYFGIFKIGKWNNLDMFDEIIIKKVKTSYSAYSRTNRSFNFENSDYRLMFQCQSFRLPLMKFQNYEDAKETALKLEEETGIKFTN